jgi:hypothetical protein
MNFSTNPNASEFLDALSRWIDGISSINVRYVAVRSGEEWLINSAVVTLGPRRFAKKTIEEIQTTNVRVGTIQKNVGRRELDSFLNKVCRGTISLGQIRYSLPDTRKLAFFSPDQSSEPSYFLTKLQIRSVADTRVASLIAVKTTNAELRILDKPFDGLTDVLSFFGFPAENKLWDMHEIMLELHPPADFDHEKTQLENDKLNVSILKHPNFPRSQVALGLRLLPNPSLDRRSQLGKKIKWKASNGLDVGKLDLSVEDTVAAELLLSLNGLSVSRYFFSDRRRSLNPRLKHYAKYDPDLKALRSSLYTSSKESRFFEPGIGALAYLMGFTPLKPPLTDAPDFLLETKTGRLILVECTTKTSDIRTKAGKLVDRRFLLMNDASSSDLGNERVLAVLVVNLPRSQIMDEANFLAQNDVLLLTREGIDRLLNDLEMPTDTDTVFDQAKQRLQEKRSALSGLLQ